MESRTGSFQSPFSRERPQARSALRCASGRARPARRIFYMALAKSGVLRKGRSRVLCDLVGQVGRRDYPTVLAQPQGQAPDPSRVRCPQQYAEPAVAEFGPLLTRVVLGNPPGSAGQFQLNPDISG